MNLTNFIENFAGKSGLEGLTVDNNGYCAFTVDGMAIKLQEYQEKDIVLIYGELGDLPAEQDCKFFKALLKMNYLFTGTRGATISLDPENEKLMLQQLYSEFSRNDADAICSKLEEFTNSLEELQRFLNDYRCTFEENGQVQNTLPENDFGANGLGGFGIKI